jgi:hypothetical protein
MSTEQGDQPEKPPSLVDPRKSKRIAAAEFSGIKQERERARQSGQKWLFFLIAGCLIFLALFDSALLVPQLNHPDTKAIIAVNAAFAGGAGILSICARYLLSVYMKP